MREFLSEEDKNTAFSFIILNLLVSVLEKDIAAIKNSKLKLKEQHAVLMERTLDRVVVDTAEIKRIMHKRGIKVFDMQNVNADFVSYKYVVRGYEAEFRCFKAALKIHTEKKLGKYYDL